MYFTKTWPRFADTNLLMQNSIQSRKEKKTLCKNFDKVLLVVPLWVLHAKQLKIKLLFESLQTYANLLLGLMPANYIPTRCVNPCLPVFIRVGISIQRHEDSPLNKTRPTALKRWSSAFFKEQNQNVKVKASIQQADERKLTTSVFMGFVLIANLCSKEWVVFTPSVPVRSCVLLSLKIMFNLVARQSSMHWDDTRYKRNASRSLKCEKANGGDCTKQPILLNSISGNTFLKGFHLQLRNF